METIEEKDLKTLTELKSAIENGAVVTERDRDENEVIPDERIGIYKARTGEYAASAFFKNRKFATFAELMEYMGDFGSRRIWLVRPGKTLYEVRSEFESGQAVWPDNPESVEEGWVEEIYRGNGRLDGRPVMRVLLSYPEVPTLEAAIEHMVKQGEPGFEKMTHQPVWHTFDPETTKCYRSTEHIPTCETCHKPALAMHYHDECMACIREDHKRRKECYKQYSFPGCEDEVYSLGYDEGVETNRTNRKSPIKRHESYQDSPETEFIDACATDSVTYRIDAALCIAQHTLTNDTSAFYDHFKRGFIAGWHDEDARKPLSDEQAAFNDLLGDVDINL
jgi:hypothetical protein